MKVLEESIGNFYFVPSDFYVERHPEFLGMLWYVKDIIETNNERYAKVDVLRFQVIDSDVFVSSMLGTIDLISLQNPKVKEINDVESLDSYLCSFMKDGDFFCFNDFELRIGVDGFLFSVSQKYSDFLSKSKFVRHYFGVEGIYG